MKGKKLIGKLMFGLLFFSAPTIVYSSQYYSLQFSVNLGSFLGPKTTSELENYLIMSEQATIEETTDSSWQQIPQETVQSEEVYEEETINNPVEIEKADEINQFESNSISDSDFVTKEQVDGESEQVYENSQ